METAPSRVSHKETKRGTQNACTYAYMHDATGGTRTACLTSRMVPFFESDLEEDEAICNCGSEMKGGLNRFGATLETRSGPAAASSHPWMHLGSSRCQVSSLPVRLWKIRDSTRRHLLLTTLKGGLNRFGATLETRNDSAAMSSHPWMHLGSSRCQASSLSSPT